MENNMAPILSLGSVEGVWEWKNSHPLEKAAEEEVLKRYLWPLCNV